MTPELKVDICVIGAGASGLSVAAGAAQLGASTVLIEMGAMGGECLNVGCVPSKSLLAAAHAAAQHRSLPGFGLNGAPATIDPARLRGHIQSVIAAIAPTDSVERFEGLGVRVIKAHARFIDRETLEAGAQRIKARRFVVAVGSRPFVPPIQGLADIDYLTNETIFDKAGDIADLAVLGGGPIGVEMAQAFARLGARVQIVEMDRLLPKDDEDARAQLRAALMRDGIAIHEGAAVKSVAKSPSGVVLRVVEKDGAARDIAAGHLLIAAGRRPEFSSLGLDKAGVETNAKGIVVDRGLLSSNPRIFAVGDCTGHPAFTHVASYHAGIVIRRAIFRLPAKVDYRALPWVTFTDPELAQVGLTEKDARAKHGADLQIVKIPFADSDRARAERRVEGFVKILADRRGHILGVTILGAHAGELIGLWCLAMSQRLKLSALASLVLPYPTLNEVSKRAAGQFYAPKLFSPALRFVARLLRLLG